MAARSYNNALRERHAASTREEILKALAGLLADPKLTELSMTKVASAAGVSSATLFRHFSSKEQLFKAASESAAERFTVSPQLADNLEGVPERISDLFEYFAANRNVMAAASRLPDLASFRDEVRRDRAERMLALVVKRYPAMPATQQRQAAAACHLIVGAQSWLSLVRDYGLTQVQAVEAARDAFEALVERLDRVYNTHQTTQHKGNGT